VEYSRSIRPGGTGLAYVVWELTLRCDLACDHCGSRAGKARPDELSTDEALDVVRQLADRS
jgi:MoaA/NifB/PqqE/SkfB family radical SAM enzyme